MKLTQSLNRDSVLSKLRTKQLGQSLEILDRCTSTNDVAAQRANAGAPHGHTVLAEEQTSGRGRQGRTWLSPRGGIWLTTVLRSPLTLDPLSALPIIGALAAAKTINSNRKVGARVRWPNDILVGDRKLAGVIAETKFKGDQLEYAILGVGINANLHAARLGELGPKSTSLQDLLGSPVEREAMIALLLMEIENVYELASSNLNDAMRLLKELDCSRGRQVTIMVEGEEVSGVVADYDSFAIVRIRTASGSNRLIETSSVISVEYPHF